MKLRNKKTVVRDNYHLFFKHDYLAKFNEQLEDCKSKELCKKPTKKGKKCEN